MKSKLWRCYDEELFYKVNVALANKKSSFQQEVNILMQNLVKEYYKGDENGKEKEIFER